MKYNLSQIKEKIGEQAILSIAKESGFEMRTPRKIDGVSFLLGFFMMVQLGKIGLNDWARQIGRLTQKLVSKQGLQKKLQFRQEAFVRSLLAHVVKQTTRGWGHKDIELFKHFNKVFVEDSSCLSLPRNLSAFYPGPHSKKHGKCATARVQLRMNLLDDSYEGIDVESYRDNDQSFAHRIMEVLQAGSLVIRDQGYFVLSAFKAIMEKDAFFLSRLRYGTNVYDEETGEKMDLLGLLKQLKKEGKQVLDKKILLGSKHKLPVRLVAVEVPNEVRKIRQHKASNDRNTKAAHNELYMELLGWTIFITNVEREVWSFKDIIRAYRYRWRIEIVFKCWKSKFNVDKFFKGKDYVCPPRVIITIYLMLIWMTLTLGWYGIFVQRVYEEKRVFLSLLKFADFIKERFWEVILEKNPDKFIEELARYYCYDKRKSREHYLESLYENLLS
ncbi:MAG: IS4 family transposase [Lewinella sp.]|uniref:IS4 family transposase n=1 Tax=Lewinella sp. TaxID=2004506 RepID=UPI003D6AF053